MSIEDKIQHLANLTMIMDFHEKLGTTKNTHLAQEFQQVHDEVEQEIKEKHNEARKSKSQQFRTDQG